MKATEAQARAALDRPSANTRLVLLYGADEAGAAALAARLGKAMGEGAERVDLDAATLKADPARLADEAAALSLFGDARWIRVTGIGEESADAVAALLDAERGGNPVVATAGSLKATGALLKRVLAAPNALACACYPPTARDAERIVTDLAREQGLRVAGSVARRVAAAGAGDRAVMAREVEKLALFLDAAPDRPQTLDDAALDAVGADSSEGEMGHAVAAVIAGDARALGAELARLGEGGVSPIVWLRALARRVQALMEMRADVAAGEETGAVMKRHRVFWKEEDATRHALARWSPAMLADALERVRVAERAVMTGGAAGETVAEQAALLLARERAG